MNNIYVGNRYVPVFANPVEWDNLRTYEALTIVTYQGTSYTSKKSVPVGIALSNAEYWVVTGNFNAQVEQYRQDVVNYTGEVDEYKVKVDSEISNRISADTVLDNKISAETNNRTEMDAVLDNKISTKKPKKRSYILIGDSFSVGIIDTNTRGKGWIKHFEESVGNRANVYYNTNMVLPGVAGFASSLPFLTLFKSAENNVPNKNEITDIVVMGGTNDASVISSVPGAIEVFCNYVHENYPNATLSIGVIGTYVQQNLDLIKAYRTCINYGARYLDTCTHIYCSKEYVSDGTHLTQNGYDFYAKYTNEIIESGRTTYTFMFPYNINGAAGQIIVTEDGIQVWQASCMIDVANEYISETGMADLSMTYTTPIALLPDTVLGTAELYELSADGIDIPRLVSVSTLYVKNTPANYVRITGGLIYPWVKKSNKIYRYVFKSCGYYPFALS